MTIQTTISLDVTNAFDVLPPGAPHHLFSKDQCTIDIMHPGNLE